LITPKVDKAIIRKNKLRKIYVTGFMKNLSMNIFSVAARTPKIVYVAAMPKTKIRLITKPLRREEAGLTPTILKVMGTSGRMQGEKLTRIPARKLTRRPSNGDAVKLLSRL
jgi:hypothetical protein